MIIKEGDYVTVSLKSKTKDSINISDILFRVGDSLNPQVVNIVQPLVIGKEVGFTTEFSVISTSKEPKRFTLTSEDFVSEVSVGVDSVTLLETESGIEVARIVSKYSPPKGDYVVWTAESLVGEFKFELEVIGIE